MTAETNVHFAELRAGLEKLASAVEDCNQRIAAVPKLWQLVVTIVGAAAGTLTIMLGVISFGGDRFDAGMGLSATNTETALAARRLAEDNDRRLAEFTRQMTANAEANDRKLTEFTLLVNTRVEASDRALAEFTRRMDANDVKFTEFVRRMDANDVKFTELGQRMDANDRKLSEFTRQMNANWEKMSASLSRVDALLPALEVIVKGRVYDQPPAPPRR